MRETLPPGIPSPSSARPLEIAIHDAKAATALVVPRGVDEQLDAERPSRLMASLQHVSQRVPGVVRELARGHHSAVNPDSEHLRPGGLGCLSRGHGEDSRVSR